MLNDHRVIRLVCDLVTRSVTARVPVQPVAAIFLPFKSPILSIAEEATLSCCAIKRHPLGLYTRLVFF